jgi:hypothetical protein
MNTDDHDDILTKSIITALDRSDRAVMVSLGILLIGYLSSSLPASDSIIELPLVGIKLARAKSSIIIILAIHFFNGVRYAFYLRRARAIAQQLPPSLSQAISSHPALCTSKFITEGFQTMLLVYLLSVLLSSSFSNMSGITLLLLTALLTSPFIFGSIQMIYRLDYLNNIRKSNNNKAKGQKASNAPKP